MKKKLKVKPLNWETYLAVIKNACGSKMWRNNYALVNGKKKDIMNNGDTQCAFFVSSILRIFGWINELHVTVEGTERDLKESNWKQIKVSPKMPKGSILIWEEKNGHSHIGFYFGNKKAVSTASSKGYPIIHDWLYSGKRQILRAYFKNLKNK